jgi:hypothetical protein
MGKRQSVTPIRFVCGCQNGHLQDIEWKWVIHGAGPTCHEPMWLQEFGTSGEPRDVRVQCDCGKSIGWEGLSIKGRLGKSQGPRPWIGDREELLDTDFEAMPLGRLYRVSDLLLRHRDAIEAALFARIRDLFTLPTTVTLYDLTNTYFEGTAADVPKAARGRSKEKRTGCPLVTLGMVPDSSGFVRKSKMFAGNAWPRA